MVSDRVLLSDAFREHVINKDSWSVSPEFIEQFPALEGRIRVERGPKVESMSPEWR